MLDYVKTTTVRYHPVGPAGRPYWDVLGTWESARLEDHELRYLELMRLFRDYPGVNAELQAAIDTARRVCGTRATV